jgi:hypothetical protein
MLPSSLPNFADALNDLYISTHSNQKQKSSFFEKGLSPKNFIETNVYRHLSSNELALLDKINEAAVLKLLINDFSDEILEGNCISRAIENSLMNYKNGLGIKNNVFLFRKVDMSFCSVRLCYFNIRNIYREIEFSRDFINHCWTGKVRLNDEITSVSYKSLVEFTKNHVPVDFKNCIGLKWKLNSFDITEQSGYASESNEDQIRGFFNCLKIPEKIQENTQSLELKQIKDQIEQEKIKLCQLQGRTAQENLNLSKLIERVAQQKLQLSQLQESICQEQHQHSQLKESIVQEQLCMHQLFLQNQYMKHYQNMPQQQTGQPSLRLEQVEKPNNI